MALSEVQQYRISWLLDGYLDEDVDPDEYKRRWPEEFAAIETPEELFVYTARSSASQSVSEWRRVLDNPLCDMGTALLVFWRNSPLWQYQFTSRDEVPEFARPGYDLVKEIAAKYLAGGYPHHTIRFNPTDFRNNNFLSSHSQDEIDRLPPELRDPSPGRSVQLL